MAKIAGRLSTFKHGGTEVNGIVDCSLDLEYEEIDVTTHDSGAAREFILGRMAGTAELSMKWDEADAGQVALETKFMSGASATGDFRMQTSAGLNKYTGTVWVTKFAASGSNDDTGDLSVSLRFTGTITSGAQ